MWLNQLRSEIEVNNRKLLFYTPDLGLVGWKRMKMANQFIFCWDWEKIFGLVK
jgi:hypothetical protein